jgi:hypothetical protein
MITNYVTFVNPAPDATYNISLVDTGAPRLVFTSTDKGFPVARGGIEQTNAVTTIALCNTGAPNLSDETVNSVTVDIYIVKKTKTATVGNKVVSQLIVPAGETVFFSEERMVLDGGDMIYVEVDVSGLLSVSVSTLPV